MKKFKYRGYDSQAVEQTGTLEAENYSEAYAALSYQCVTVVKLEPAQASFGQIAENFLLKLKLGGQWRSVFFRELGVMLGVMTLHESLRTLAGANKNHPSEKILSELAAAVGEGQSFATALTRYEIIFGGDAIQSVEIGEASGNLRDGKLGGAAGAQLLNGKESARRNVLSRVRAVGGVHSGNSFGQRDFAGL